MQGPPEIKETHGKISLGTHYSKKENVKARPKKVEQETRTGNEKTQKGRYTGCRIALEGRALWNSSNRRLILAAA